MRHIFLRKINLPDFDLSSVAFVEPRFLYVCKHLPFAVESVDKNRFLLAKLVPIESLKTTSIEKESTIVHIFCYTV